MADSINSKAKEYYDNDDTGGSLNSNLKDFLVQQGATGKSINTLWRDYAYGEGGTSLNTRLRNLWGTSGSLMKRWKDTLGLTWDEVKAFFNFRDTEPDFLLDGSTSFDGTDDYIACGSDSSLDNIFAGGGTVSAWIKADGWGESVTGRIITKSNSNDIGWNIFVEETGSRLYLRSDWSTTDMLRYATSAITLGQWHHIAITYDSTASAGTDPVIYVDGVSKSLSGTASAGTVVDDSNSNLEIGHRAGGNDREFDGKIANVGIWDRALSASEVESIQWRGSHSELKDTELTNLVSWYDLDSTSLGSELVTNGTYSTGDFTGWTTGNGWSVVDEVATFSYTDEGNSKVLQDIGLQSGKRYKLTFDYTRSAGSLTVREYASGYVVLGTFSDASDSVELDFTSTSSNGILYITAVSTTFAGTIDNVSVKEIQAPDAQGSNEGSIYGATTNTDSYSGESPFKPRIQDKATPKMAVQLADGSTSFDGSNDYISIADADNLSFGDGSSDSAFSASAWIKMNDATNFPILVKGVYNTSGEWKASIGSDDKLYFMLMDESVADTFEYAYTSALTSYENEWLHVCCVYDGRGGTSANAGMKIYLNGSEVSVTLSDGGTYVAMENLGADLHIGKDEAQYADGSIANVAIHSSALTQSQVQELMFTEKYSGLSSDLKTNLVSWYDLGSVELGTSLITGDSSNMDTVGSWTAGSWASAVNGSVTSVSGGQTGNAIKVDTDSGRAFARYNSTSGVTVVNGRSYRFSVWGKNGEGEGIVALAYTYGYTHYVNDASATSVEGKVSTYDFQSQDTDLHIALLQASSGNSVLWDDVTVKPINVADSHGSNTGEVYGATTTTGYTSSPHGVVDPLNFGEVYSGRALDFDGSNDYVEVASNGTGTFNNQSYSISAWVNFDEVTSDHAIFSYDNTAHSGTYYASHLRLTGGDKKFFFGWNDGSSYQGLTSASTYLADTWYHVVVTFTSGSQKMYVNGSLDTSSTRSDTITYYAQEVWIGRANYGAYIDGSINSLKYFDSVLTQDQIRQLYTKPETVLPTGVSASNLKLDLPMQEGSGSYVYDGSGNQKHGTISGASWVTGQQYGYQSSLVRSNTPMIFDGNNDGVEIPSSPSLQTWNSKATVQAWVYPNSATDWDGIWGGATASTGTSLSFGSGNTIKLSSDGGSPTVSSTGTVNLKKWNHVVVSYDGSTAYFYINGSSAGSGSYSQDAVASTNIVLGQYYAGSSSTSYKFDGIINEVAYWDVALDADAVTQLYNSGVPLLPTSDSGNYDNSDSLVGYWRNDSNSTWTDRANTGVASFDGTNDRINLGSSVDAGTNSTTSIWFKRKTFTSHQALIGEDDNSSDYHMYVYSSNNFFVRNGTKYYVYTDSATTTALNTTDWVHVALVREGISGKLYINGILTETETMESGTSWTANTTFDTIGAKPSGSNGIDGQIAGTHLFNIALTASEVTELYNIDKRSSISGHSQFSNCVGSWLMGAGTGDTASTIQDQTSNNNDGTVNGASIIGYNDGTASGSPVSIVIPEGSTEGRDNQGYYLSNTTSTSNNGLRMYGGGEVIKLDDSELFHLGTKDFTFEFWAKFNETSTTRGFFNYFKDANNRFHLSNYANIDFWANVGGSDQSTQVSNTRDLDWHHYVITKESNTMKIYIDSSVVKTNTSWTQDINFTGGTFYIGVRTDDGSDLTSYNVDGSIDEFRIYHKALSSSEVSKNYTNGLGKHS